MTYPDFIAEMEQYDLWDHEICLRTHQGEFYTGYLVKELPEPERRGHNWLYLRGRPEDPIVGMPVAHVQNIDLFPIGG